MQIRFIPRFWCSSCVRLAAGLALAGLFAGLALADPPTDSSDNADDANADGGTRPAEDRVPDPVPRTSAEDILDNPFLRNALSRSHEGLEVTREPDGTLTMDLEGRFHNVATATVNDDGEIETRCGHGHESLETSRDAHPDAEPPESEPARGGEGGDDP